VRDSPKISLPAEQNGVRANQKTRQEIHMRRPAAPLHPAIPDLHSDLRHGRLSRREFVRLATLLGASAAAAYALAGCTPAARPTDPNIPPTPVPPHVIRRGGTMRIGTKVSQHVDHPARLEWLESANQFRQVAEYLTETGPDNVTRPWLLTHWETDHDARTWTLYLRQDVTFNNGDPLTADDVIFNLEQWLNPKIASSMLNLLPLRPTDIERVDTYTVRLHLHTPQIGLPEHLFHYPAMIMHRSFEGNFVRQAIGTGPFLLDAYEPHEYALFVRRSDYWRRGDDGRPLPYLDRLLYVDLAPDERVAAMQGGMLDTIFLPRPADWEALRVVPNLVLRPTQSAQTLVLRMQVDQVPWTDPRVRMALKLCQDREKILQVSFFGQGDLAHDAHVAPIHPAFCAQSIPPYNPEQARALLNEAGYPNGLDIRLTTKNDQGEPEMARALKELAAPAGFNIELNIIEPQRYQQNRWKEVALGITQWFHRPLDTMALALGYTADRTGQPAPWNETHWEHPTFARLLREAEGTLDVQARRALMCQIQTLMQEQGPIGISYWSNVWRISRAELHQIEAHPNGYDMFTEVWKEDAHG
jgi:peptide/nickel transport system substrate-binding protein